MGRDVYSLGIFYAIGPQPGMNVLHFAEDTEESENPDVNAQGCIAGFMEEIEEAWLATIPADTRILGYKCRRVNNGGGPGISQPRPGVTGTRTGVFSVSGIGPVHVWSYQKLAGGWAAGRTFVPGVSEDDVNENQFDDNLITACQDLHELLLAVPCFSTTTPVLNFEFVIYSPTHDTISGVEAAGVSGKPGVQNRRMKPTF